MSSTRLEYLGESMVVEWSVEQETEDPGLWAATMRVTDNSIGGTALFVINEALDHFLGTCSPMQEDGIPVEPAVNDLGETRISHIRFRHRLMSDAREAVSGVLNDLEEYLRSKVIFRDQMNSRRLYTFEVSP